MTDHDPGSSAAPDSSGRATNVRWLVFALSCGTSWFLYLHRYTWNFIGPALKNEYGLSEIEAATLGGMFNLSYGILQIPSGIFCDLIGAHLFLGAIIVLWALSLPLLGITGNLYGLGAFRLMFGATQAGAYPSLSKVTHAWFPQRSRTIVQGWVATFFGRSGGAMSSIIMATFLIGYCGLSWRMSLVVMSLFGLAFGVLFLIFFRSSPAVDPRVNSAEREIIDLDRLPDHANAPKVLPWRRVLRNRSMFFFVIQQMTSAGADTVYSMFMGGYFLSRGVDLAQAGILVSLPLWGGAIGGMFGGYCNDFLIRITGSRRWGHSIVGFTGKALACGLMFVAIAQEDPTAAGIALFVVKFFSDWSQPTVWGTCTDLGGKYSASVFGIINTSGTIGGVLAPPLFGWILDLWSTHEIVDGVEKVITNYGPLFTVVGILYIISAACWFLIDCTASLERELEPVETENLT